MDHAEVVSWRLDPGMEVVGHGTVHRVYRGAPYMSVLVMFETHSQTYEYEELVQIVPVARAA